MKSLEELLDPCDVVVNLAPHNYAGLVEDAHRVGVMVHYDASQSDKGAVNWYQDPDWKLSYNRAYTDSGRRVRITPSIRNRAYHAGACRKDRRVIVGANTAFYGLCITANNGDVITMPQYTSLAYDTAVIARYHRWTSADIDYWLTGHNEWAVFGNGKLGRKIDPVGSDPKRPVIHMPSLRAGVGALLDSTSHPIWKRFSQP